MTTACASPALEVAPRRQTPVFTPVALPPVFPSQPSSQPRSIGVRSLNVAAVVRSSPRLPRGLREEIAQCARLCGVGEPTYVRLQGMDVEAALVDVDGFNGQVGSVVVASTGLGTIPTVVFVHYGVDGWVDIDHGLVRLHRSMYALDDAEAAPSGPTEVSLYRWNGRHFMLQNRTGGGAKYGPYLPNDEVVS